MAILTANFERGSNGATITTSSGEASATAWSLVNNSVVYSNAHAAHGTLSATTDGTDGNILFWINLITETTNHYGRFYFYTTGNPAARFNLIKFVQTPTDTKGYITINSAGKVEIVDNFGGHSQASSTSIALNQWVRIEWHAIISATVGQLEVKLFNSPDSTTVTETVTSPATWDLGTATNDLWIFDLDGTWGNAIWIDDIVANATSYPGPVASPATAGFELGTLGATVAITDAGNATAWNARQSLAGGAAPTYDNTHAITTQALKIANGGGGGYAEGLSWDAAIGALSNYYWRHYIYFEDLPSATGQFHLVRTSLATLGCYSVQCSSAGVIFIKDAADTTLATFSTVMPTDQWVRLEGHAVHSTNSIEVRLFTDAHSLTPTETETSSSGALRAAASETYYGCGSLSTTVWWDAIVFGADDWVGPAVTPSTVDVLMPRHGVGMGRW